MVRNTQNFDKELYLLVQLFFSQSHVLHEKTQTRYGVWVFNFILILFNSSVNRVVIFLLYFKESLK